MKAEKMNMVANTIESMEENVSVDCMDCGDSSGVTVRSVFEDGQISPIFHATNIVLVAFSFGLSCYIDHDRKGCFLQIF